MISIPSSPGAPGMPSLPGHGSKPLPSGSATPTPSASLVSASARIILPANGQNFGGNNYTDYRFYESAVVRMADIRPLFGAEYTTASYNRVDMATAGSYCYSILVNCNGRQDDQSAATQLFATFNGAMASGTWTDPEGVVHAYIQRSSSGAKVAATYADFLAAGGSIVEQTAGNGQWMLTIPGTGGWLVWADAIVLPSTMQPGAIWAHQYKVWAAAGAGNGLPRSILSDSINDRQQAASSFAAGILTNKNWTGRGGTTTGIGLGGPLLVVATCPDGKKTVCAGGDSISYAQGDAYGDAVYQSSGAIRRALSAAGYPTISTAISGGSATGYNNGTDKGLMDYLTSFCHVEFHEFGHNEGGRNAIAPNRTYHLRRRTLLRGPKRIIASTLAPDSTAGYNTAPNVTSITSSGTTMTVTHTGAGNITVGRKVQIGASTVPGYEGITTVASVIDSTHFTAAIPGGGADLPAATSAKVATAQQQFPTDTQYSSYAPYVMRTGSYAGVPFDRSVGDPDAGWDMYTALGAVEGFHATLMSSLEGRHPLGRGNGQTSPAVANAAADLQPKLSALLGF